MAKRHNITRAVRTIIADAAKRLPEFDHIDPRRILVVAGEARRASHASVRPLYGPRRARPAKKGKPGKKPRYRTVVKLSGRQMLYCITLRPIFFRDETVEKRVETILHELFHISTRFDGTLHAGRRHARLGKKFEKRLRPLVKRYLKAMPEELYTSLSVNGLVAARQWLEKPGITSSSKRNTARSRRVYTEKELFLGPLRMITRGARRPVPGGRIH